jgi:hypothetical protein
MYADDRRGRAAQAFNVFHDRRRPAVRADPRNDNARRTAVAVRGVRIGTTLPELVRLVGKPLTFSGFGWDYGGGLNWFEPSGSIGLGLSLTHDDALAKLPRADEIYGDREVRSDHPVVQRARITVDEITMSWGSHAGEHDCG